jgi:tripartite-type tricarboxylate transporter receptor subunit TctC
MIWRRVKIGCLALGFGLLIQGGLNAQGYPQRPITIIVGAAAGGSADTAVRLISDRMSALLGAQIVVENVPGAGGMTGTARVARSNPDGYTLMMQQTGIATLSTLYPGLPFSVEKDLVAVGLVNTSASFLVGRKSLPANNFNELVAWMKNSPNPAKVAHQGVGSLGHLTAVLFAKAVGVEVNLIPYRGVGPAMNDLVGEHIDVSSGSVPVAAPLIAAGNIKGYALSANKRYPPLANVPTFGDLGYPQLERPFWHALFAPSGTPRPILDKLNAALRDTLADPEIKKAYEERGLDMFPPQQLTLEAAATYVKAETELWSKVIRENNIKID